MSLNPSNGIAQRANPKSHVFPNLARRDRTPEVFAEVDAACKAELEEAGIEPYGWEWIRDVPSEVPTKYRGQLPYWGFGRAWYYWVAEGQGIPTDKAEEFHKEWGTQVRVNGHCGCPSPIEDNGGFAIGLYHIDTQEGLNAFAELLRSICHPLPR